jgi:hypothetical protein
MITANVAWYGLLIVLSTYRYVVKYSEGFRTVEYSVNARMFRYWIAAVCISAIYESIQESSVPYDQVS